MTAAAHRVCPNVGCHALIDLATQEELEAGHHLWQCTNGHHGPAAIGFSGYAEP